MLSEKYYILILRIAKNFIILLHRMKNHIKQRFDKIDYKTTVLPVITVYGKWIARFLQRESLMTKVSVLLCALWCLMNDVNRCLSV